MSSTLHLAALIARMNRDELLSLVRSRRVSTHTSVNDPLGLALELLRPESITRAISGLDVTELTLLQQPHLHAALLGTDERTWHGTLTFADQPDAPAGVYSLGDHLGTLISLGNRGLLGCDERSSELRSLEDVRSRIVSALELPGHVNIPEDADSEYTPDPLRPDAASATATWYAQAITAVRLAAALLGVLERQPVKMNRKGLVAATGLRTLADQVHSDPATVASIIRALQWADLITQITDPGSHAIWAHTTNRSAQWLASDYPTRWLALATGVRNALSPEVSRVLELHPKDFAYATGEHLERIFPLLHAAAREEATTLAATAESIGATAAGWCSAAFSLLLDHRDADAAHAAASDIPEPVPGVYVQPDLTVIAPGPLTPEAEAALAAFTEIDQLGVAAVLRITPNSLQRGIRLGRTPADIRTTVTELSLTGVPQPLDFFLTDLERERPAPPTAQRPGAAWIEQRLAQHDSPGAPEVTGMNSLGSEPQVQTDPDPLEALVERVHSAAHAAAGSGDLSRILELAIRDKRAVHVTAAAGADVRTFTLLPVAVTGGRLRATDTNAGVERTLPLTAITTVQPA